MYGRRTCQGGGNFRRACDSDADCPLGNGTNSTGNSTLNQTAKCTPEDAFAVKGAAAWHYVEAGSRELLFGANFWDGADTDTSSPVFELVMGGSATNLVQMVPTRGARQWTSFASGNMTYACVANARGNSGCYPLHNVGSNNSTNTSNNSTNTGPVISMGYEFMGPAVGVVHFEWRNGGHYVAFAAEAGVEIWTLHDSVNTPFVLHSTVPITTCNDGAGIGGLAFFNDDDGQSYIAVTCTSGPSPLLASPPGGAPTFSITDNPLTTVSNALLSEMTLLNS